MIARNKNLPGLIILLISAAALAAAFTYYKNPDTSYETNVTVDVPAKEVIESTNMLFGGDVMMGRTVESLMKENGADYPFEKIGEFLKSMDFVSVNFEGPITENHKRTPNGSTRFTFDAFVVDALKDNNISHVSLANNHTLDFYQASYDLTKQILEKQGIATSGHPEIISSDYVYSKKIQGRIFKFISFHRTYNNFDDQKALDLVTKEKDPNSFIIINIHWGDEYKLASKEYQQNFAHKLIDAGADLIIGHHPHVVQEIEKYKNKLIFYSLGNFIFDQYFSKDTQEGLLVGMNIEGDSIKYSLYPIKSVKSQPELMTKEDKDTFLISLAKRSGLELASQINRGLIEP